MPARLILNLCILARKKSLKVDSCRFKFSLASEMLYLLLILNLIINFSYVEPKKKVKKNSHENSDLGGNLVSQLKNDQNLDLSVDEEYEDLRAEFLAYHTALASIVPSPDQNGRSKYILIS